MTLIPSRKNGGVSPIRMIYSYGCCDGHKYMLIDIVDQRWFMPWFFANLEDDYTKYLRYLGRKADSETSMERRERFVIWYAARNERSVKIEDGRILIDFSEEEVTWNTLRY